MWTCQGLHNMHQKMNLGHLRFLRKWHSSMMTVLNIGFKEAPFTNLVTQSCLASFRLIQWFCSFPCSARYWLRSFLSRAGGAAGKRSDPFLWAWSFSTVLYSNNLRISLRILYRVASMYSPLLTELFLAFPPLFFISDCFSPMIVILAGSTPAFKRCSYHWCWTPSCGVTMRVLLLFFFWAFSALAVRSIAPARLSIVLPRPYN